MNYNVTEDVITETSQSYINTGISNDVELSHRVEISKNGSPFLEYAYTNEKGQNIKKTEWPVRDPKPFEERSQKGKDYILEYISKEKEKTGKVLTPGDVVDIMHQWDVDKQMKRILYVAKKFVPAQELRGDFSNFKEFITFISNKIGDKCKGVKLRSKFIWDDEGKYVTTPNKVLKSEPWLERVDEISEEDSQIKILATDKIVRSNSRVVGTRAPQKENPLEIDGDDKSSTDDMPF